MARILVVEDDPLVRHAFVPLLRIHGHDVTVATRAQDALQACAAQAQDIILLDIGLPDQDGIECARALRKRKVRTPIVFLTAYGGAEFVERALETEPYAYLVKPISGEQLAPIVNSALAAAQAGIEREDRLLAALSDSRAISAAVGMLAERYQWSVEQAFETLRIMARSEGRRVVDVAAEITRRLR